MKTAGENPLAASVKQRLLNVARESGTDFNQLLLRYATERLLYRLSKSRHSNAFLLKGAMLFVLWEPNPHRPTKDLDLLFDRHEDRTELEDMFVEVTRTEVEPDGLVFDSASVKADEIRESQAYGGIRIKLLCYLGNGRIPLQVDVGMGDDVYPIPDAIEFPTLLNFPSPRIRPYPVYSVVAEKFQAMVELQDRNSRMKDFYDVLYILSRFEFSGKILKESIERTFHRRKTEIPVGTPPGLDSDFWQNEQKQTQWNAFLRKNRLGEGLLLKDCIEEIFQFIKPVLDDPEITAKTWIPEKGWISD